MQAGPFMIKVDPKAQGCLDYYDVIKQPMWLDRIKAKLGTNARREYTHPVQFLEDMRLVWANCRKYNGETTEIRHAASCADQVRWAVQARLLQPPR